MEPSSRDRISVDLRGLKAALLERAQALGVSPSGLVRTSLAGALGQPDRIQIDGSAPRLRSGDGNRTRLCLRMSRTQARATMEAARLAGMNPGDYVGGLVANVPVLTAGGSRSERITVLIASCAELATLSRNIHRLTALLRQANVEPARRYRAMLDALTDDVRSHLELAAGVLADLRPRGGGVNRPAEAKQLSGPPGARNA